MPLLTSLSLFFFQAEEWLNASVLAQEGPLPQGRLLLEEEEGREDHEGGSHEAKGPGNGGKQHSLT